MSGVRALNLCSAIKNVSVFESVSRRRRRRRRGWIPRAEGARGRGSRAGAGRRGARDVSQAEGQRAIRADEKQQVDNGEKKRRRHARHRP
jgi:hypothetical protein